MITKFTVANFLSFQEPAILSFAGKKTEKNHPDSTFCPIKKSNAKFVCGNVLSLKESFPSDKKFDIVLCYGVLYHLSDPLRALINLFEITNEYLILEGIFYDSVGKNLEEKDGGQCLLIPGQPNPG